MYCYFLKDHSGFHSMLILSEWKLIGNQIYLESIKSSLFHLSNIMIYLSFFGSTDMTNVLCPPNDLFAFSPMQGLPIAFHSPNMESAIAYSASLGSHPLHPEVIR